jgi:hypothetical protein
MTPPAEAALEPTPQVPEVAKTVTSGKGSSGDLALNARQFVRAKGYRWERAAGFLLESAQQLGRDARLTVAEWQPRWDAFWQRPVK